MSTTFERFVLLFESTWTMSDIFIITWRHVVVVLLFLKQKDWSIQIRISSNDPVTLKQIYLFVLIGQEIAIRLAFVFRHRTFQSKRENLESNWFRLSNLLRKQLGCRIFSLSKLTKMAPHCCVHSPTWKTYQLRLRLLVHNYWDWYLLKWRDLRCCMNLFWRLDVEMLQCNDLPDTRVVDDLIISLFRRFIAVSYIVYSLFMKLLV